MAFVANLTALAGVALVVIALASVVLVVIFAFLAKALISNTASIKLLTEHLDIKIVELTVSVQKSIEDVNAITHRVSEQMDRVENIVGNIEHLTSDARASMRIVNATVTPALGSLHGIFGGVRAGVDAWKEQGMKKEEENDA